MKKIIVLLSFFILFTLSGCHIEDTNGEDDFSLVELTDEDFFKASSSSKTMSIRTQINNKGKMKVKKFSGVELLDSIYVKNKKLTIKLSSEVKSGNFKIVVIKDDEIIKVLNINEANQEFVIENANGLYLLKVAGESANFSINYEINVN